MDHSEHAKKLLDEWKAYGFSEIIREDGTCDWKAVHELAGKPRFEERELWYVLLEKHILSTVFSGNYIITRNNRLWGPYFGMVGHLAFVSQEDAQGYFENFYDRHGGLDDGPASIFKCELVEEIQE